MRKTLLAIVALFSFTVCFSQIKAPVQYDTLVVRSMQYNLMDIHEENWTFDRIIRTPSYFLISGTEFEIYETIDMGRRKEFRLQDQDGKRFELDYEEDGENVIIEYSGYKLICSNPHPSLTSPKPHREKSVTAKYTLEGRTVSSGLFVPYERGTYEGTIVVKISVDRYGQVIKATAGAEGTTFKDDEMWKEVVRCAKETHFNMDGDAPEAQSGTIAYIFTR